MAARTRRPIVAGNWKMHLTRSEAAGFCRALRAGLSDPPAEVVLFPSFPLLAAVAEALAGSGVGLGGQDVHPEARGAHTGDVSAAQLADAGCRWVLCGHSERRRDHGETDGLVAAKVTAALEAGLVPVACVGETREERRSGRTFEVLARQLEPLPDDPRLVLAYEPVWAIGTGETATPETAEDAHAFLRERLARRAGADAAEATRILYGGSVTPDNASGLASRAHVDGFLVGGASLDPARFLAILSTFAPPGATLRGTP
jgi:triosephosphate isomerase